MSKKVVAPYTSGDLIRLATDRRGVQPLDPARVLATYAHPDNWVSVNAKDENGEMRNYWSWAGPMIVGYELAGYGLRAAIAAVHAFNRRQAKPAMHEDGYPVEEGGS